MVVKLIYIITQKVHEHTEEVSEEGMEVFLSAFLLLDFGQSVIFLLFIPEDIQLFLSISRT
jgi:hypothetical protein